MLPDFVERIKNVWAITLFGIISPLLLIYCSLNLIDVIKIGYLAKSYDAPIVIKTEKICTSGGGRKRRHRESYTCYDYSIEISNDLVVNFTDRTSHNLGDTIRITIVENQPEIYRMSEKKHVNHDYLLNSPEFWMTLFGLLISAMIFFKIYIKGPIYLVNDIVKNSLNNIKKYILPIIITYATIGYVISLFDITWDDVIHFRHILMRF